MLRRNKNTRTHKKKFFFEAYAYANRSIIAWNRTKKYKTVCISTIKKELSYI